MGNTIQVKYNEHYKLYVLLKDYILFEYLLIENKIDYYYDIVENSNVSSGIRFFIQDKDRSLVNELLIKNEIIASTETILLTDYEDGKKVYKFQLYTYLIVIAIVILIILIGSYL
jgi:hypothetical protein